MVIEKGFNLPNSPQNPAFLDSQHIQPISLNISTNLADAYRQAALEMGVKLTVGDPSTKGENRVGILLVPPLELRGKMGPFYKRVDEILGAQPNGFRS